jgi:hypothetical protein
MTTWPSCWIPRVRTLTTPRGGFDRDSRFSQVTHTGQEAFDILVA